MEKIKTEINNGKNKNINVIVTISRVAPFYPKCMQPDLENPELKHTRTTQNPSASQRSRLSISNTALNCMFMEKDFLKKMTKNKL
jgi:hypothetical protein